MFKHGARRRSYPPIWHVAFCLMLLAFVGRAVIPVGFMPDTGALRDGRVLITFCSASGGTLATLNLSDKSDHGSGTDTATVADCPFGLLAAQAVLPTLNAAVILAAAFRRDLPAPFYTSPRPPLPAQGPPLGSRAPPSLLG